MGRASSSKKVSRAASTGGGRTSGGRTPWVWYGSMTLVVALGVLLIVSSRSDLDEAGAIPPTFSDHWHSAYGVYVCDSYIPPLRDTQGDRLGIHSHEDGLIHIHPTSQRSAGRNAVFGIFLDEIGVELSTTELKLPGRDPLEDGDDCNGQPGEVRTLVWENPDDPEARLVAGDPNELRLAEAQVVAIVFAPSDADIPKPPSVGTVPTDLPGAQPPVQVPPPPAEGTPPEGTPPPAEGAPPEGTATPPGDGQNPPP